VIVNLTFANLRTGRAFDPAVLQDPPGYVTYDSPYNHVKAHVLAKVLGGPGNIQENFTTMYEKANHPGMSIWENQVRDALIRCETVHYEVHVNYTLSNPLPNSVDIDAESTSTPGTINIHQSVPNVH
jgi:hypothetical protein